MTRRATAAVAATAMILLAPSAAAAAVDSSISLQAPRTVKAGKAFTVIADATFDTRLYNPPYSYVALGVWQHRGDDQCLKAVPVDRSGWKQVIRHDFYPEGDPSDDYTHEFSYSLKLKNTGTYRWCGYVYTIEYASWDHVSYHPKARAQASTSVRR